MDLITPRPKFSPHNIQRMIPYSLKGHGHDFGQIFIFLLLLFTMLYECISNDEMKFGCQSMSFKQDTGLTILRHVNKARALFLFT